MAETINPESLTKGGPRWWEWLFTPFHYVAGGTALVIGVVAILVAGWLGAFSLTHFDGVLDMHTGRSAPAWVFVAEGFADWLSLTLILLLLGKMLSRTAFRAVDLLGTQAMARWPMVLAAAGALLPGYQRGAAALTQAVYGAKPSLAGADMAAFAAAAFVTVVAIIWMIALAYQSYRLCCNLRGATAVVSFVVGLLMAEVVSKLAVVAMLHATGLPAPAPPQAAAPAPSALVQQADRFVDLLAKGDYQTAVQSFDPTMRAALPADKLKATWEGLLAQSGPFQARVSDRTAQEAGFDVVYVTCQFQKQRMAVKIVFDQSQHISGLWFVPPP